jgi:hypothetical protein
MKWNGRQYRPANAQFITKKKPFDFQEALKPYGEKEMPAWSAIVGVNNETTSVPTTPTPTPSNTPTGTPNPTSTPSNTPTGTPTQTPTNTPTTTLTLTPTNTGSPTPTPTSSPIPSGTTEANAYLSAVVDAGGTGITSTVSAATRTLFTSLVSNGLWESVSAFYPMLGGNSNGCKFNGKNPLDTNGAYRLTFNGGWTFNASGATSNGTNAYADTYYYPSGTTLGNQHLSVYMMNNSNPAGTGRNYFGSYDENTQSFFSLGAEGTPRYFYGVSTFGGVSTSVSPNTQGMILASTTGSTSASCPTFLFKNGSTIQSGTYNLARNNFKVYLGALNNSDFEAQQYYANQYSFATLGLGLSQAQASTLTTIINTFQTTLGRNTFS